MKRIVLAILLAVVLTVSLLTVGAAAENVLYIDADDTQQTCASYTAVTNSTDAWTAAVGAQAWYVVNSDVTIDTRITVTGDVHLILADGRTLNATRGISVTSDNSLTIYGQSEGTGKLTAGIEGVEDDYFSPMAYYAGIGGVKGNDGVYAHGNITINGGSITAYGGIAAAGIGGGFGVSSKKDEHGTITINGGTVNATGGDQGAGIGDGSQNNATGGNIIINGGGVTAKGGEDAAGIGGGKMARYTPGRSITISGGTVNATGGSQAAGIGSGYSTNGVKRSIGVIKINGSADVTATGGAGAAGIGSSYEGTITGAIQIGGNVKVKATGGDSYGSIIAAGAGIGSGGNGGKVGNITILGGTVDATGGTAVKTVSGNDLSFSGAGIGSGGSISTGSTSNAIVINAGTINATGGEGAAGIGSGAGDSKSGDFSTDRTFNGETVPGKAVIRTNSITDTDTSDWNAVVFADGVGTVYGDVTLGRALTVKKTETLTVPEGTSLTVPEGKTLTVNGTLNNEGQILNYGMIDKNGTIKGTQPVNNPVATYTNASGTTYYETVGAAISASNAGGGGTITLLQDTSFSANLNLANQITLTIDLGTHTLTSTSEGGITIGYNGVETEGCNLTIKNGTYENTHAEGTAIWGFAEGSITIEEDAIIKAVDTCICTGGNYDTSGRTVINVYGKLYCEGTAVWCQGPDNDINIYGAEIEAGEYAVFHTYKYGGSEISIKDSKLTGDEYAVYLGNTIDSSYGKHKLIVENSQLKSNKFGICVEHSDVDIKGENTLIDVPDGYALAVIYNNSNLEGTTGTLNIEGGTLNGLIAELDPSPGTENKAVLTVSGGKFDTNVDGEYVAANLKYGAWDGEYFTYHETREDAIEAAAPNGYIFVVTGPGHITYTVTIVYGNGSANDSWLVVDNEEINLPTAPSKPGYIFLGWRNGNVTYGAGDPVVVTSNMTFTAVWANMPDVTPGTPGGGDEPVVTFPFNDVSVLDWYYDAVKYVYDNDLMNGTDVNQFSPNSPLTRAMVWAVLARVDGETISGDSWMTEAQAWAVESGVSDGTDPTGYVTREQLVTMLYRFAGEPAGAADISGYPDAATISDWAADAMAWAVKVGLIEGDDVGALNPTANSTRAHAATFFMRFSKTIL